MKFVSIFIGLAVFFLLLISIVIVREKKASSTLIAKTDDSDEDFISKFSRKKQDSLERKPWAMKYGTYKALAILCSAICGISAFLLSKNFLLMVASGCIGLLIPECIIIIKGNASKADFESRYATSLKQLVAGLKSGLSIHQAVENVCSSPFIHDSVKADYEILDADLKLGISVDEAFQRMAERVELSDAKDVAMAIRMQAEVGGREAATIEAISKNISDRIMLRKEVKTLFAGSNMTVLAMDFAPFLVVMFMYVSVPGYLTPFFASNTMIALFVGLLLFMGLGSIVVHNTIKRMKKECGVS